VLDADPLLASAAISFQCLHLGGERSRQLVECPLSTVLLRDILYMGEPTGEGYGGIVNRCHLNREHSFDLVARLYALDECEH